MKIRFALALTALLPLMVACKAQDGSADAAAPASAPAAADVSSEAASATTPATTTADDQAVTPPAGGEAAPAASTPVPAAARLVGPEPVAGTDYLAIDGGQPFQPATGKIEVAEVFGYVCPACARFQPLVSSWKAGLPADVNFVYVPAAFGGTWDDYARAFYAPATRGVLQNTNEPLYLPIHVALRLTGERGRDSVQDIASFYGKHGVDPKTFADTMGSFSVAAKINRAKQFAQRSKIAGTPSLIVNGKYLVKGQSWEDMLRIADHLIARERASNAK